MYNIKLSNDIPEPKPATADRIVAVHYYPAWKKGAPGVHNGFDDLHDFPERTPLMGYYDEENPDVCDWEIKWALEHGINCFIYCWYRKKDNEGKPVTVDDLRCGHGIHEALFNAKYGDKMKFAIMYEQNARWGTTDKDDIINNLIPFWTEQYFKRDNYLKIDNKPVLFIFYEPFMDKIFSSKEEQRETLERCREYAKNAGFNGLIIATGTLDNNKVSAEHYHELDEKGYDFHFSYNAGYSPAEDFPTDEEIIEGQCSQLRRRLEPNPLTHIPTASCFRDATPRRTKAWTDQGYTGWLNETIYHLSPEGYRTVIKKMKEICDELPEGAWGKRIFMIDNWNEWDEGHYVSPSHEYGFKYLQAIREELTERDNLPDYRTPQDLGFDNLNKSWGNPDLREKCKSKFGVK